MAIFMPIGCNLPFNPQTHYFKLQKLEFKQLIDNMAVDLWSSLNFVNMDNIQR